MDQILVVEDDTRISNFLVKGLNEYGFSITHFDSAEKTLENIGNRHWDLIIVDVMLPGLNGFQLVETLRFKKILTPIIMLTALGESEDKIKGFNIGADDYLTKPFQFTELVARINALLRRIKGDYVPSNNEISVAGLLLDTNERIVKIHDEPIELSPKEFKLLQFFVNNIDRALSRTEILNVVWGLDFETHTNVVDVYVSYLRTKIETKINIKLIHTVKGVGYIFKIPKS